MADNMFVFEIMGLAFLCHFKGGFFNFTEEQVESDKLSEETSIICFYEEEENMKKKELSSLKVPFEEGNSNITIEKENEHICFEQSAAIKGYHNLKSLLDSTDEDSEEISNIATFLALAHLHGTTTIPYRLPSIRKTKIWRPSKQEVREGFIAHVTSATEVSQYFSLSALIDKLHSFDYGPDERNKPAALSLEHLLPKKYSFIRI
ncbi:hypothetical protein EVAR_89285_1 [Eumeta japonica]|uniref:Uncharacterized protein n=1 Tax=Eumeta variegata TaxID=151549 RepID=A0A4C1YU95_EUMVA|nr:hypothetical protein EVAR_89285_1 [Eumeta japonica]